METYDRPGEHIRVMQALNVLQPDKLRKALSAAL